MSLCTYIFFSEYFKSVSPLFWLMFFLWEISCYSYSNFMSVLSSGFLCDCFSLSLVFSNFTMISYSFIYVYSNFIHSVSGINAVSLSGIPIMSTLNCLILSHRSLILCLLFKLFFFRDKILDNFIPMNLSMLFWVLYQLICC